MEIDFKKNGGLVPAIVQDSKTSRVLMLGYMNKESLEITMETRKVTFYSRSQEKIWTKGETSGNFLKLKKIKVDCDGDTLLIKARPKGPVCHTGDETCWGERNIPSGLEFISYLEKVIRSRKTANTDKSYTAQLLKKGVKKISKKVGEEASELILEAVGQKDDLFLEEAADLLYHYMVLLMAKGYSLKDVIKVLEKRHSR
jgi:phosphoribosyl-ATP pyrophosphohydrolase/phosphoribosyl-AMP cyclohydrolase